MTNTVELSQLIYEYYLQEYAELTFDKQFHFASRLHLWSQDTAAGALLQKMRPEFTADDNPAQALRNVYAAAQESPVHGSKNAAELRRPYFEKYPKLKTYVMLLFRTAFLESIYGIDVRDTLFDLCPTESLNKQFADLMTDSEAVAILSTHAVNFIYLYSRYVKQDETMIDPAYFMEIGRTAYNLDDKIHIQLLIYLYTHCIIGESKFYCRKISDTTTAPYRAMARDLETVIAKHFDDINLDNKFEYLVCCKMVGIHSSLENKIFDEAVRSVSHSGVYLVDTHNNNPQLANTTLAKSEHRNVLFVMANRHFSPLG